MSDYDSLIDPEAQALLIEAAKNPNSVLFKIERPERVSRYMARGGDLFVTDMTGLPSVEKKLLEVYREEAAFLLRLAYFELSKAMGDARKKGLFFPADPNRQTQIGIKEIGLMIASKREHLVSDTRALADLEIAARLSKLSGSQLILIPQASLRLAPSHSAESYVGIELMLAGDFSAAEGILHSLVERVLDAKSRATHACSLANIQLNLGKVESGLQYYRKATIANPLSAASAFSMLWSSGIKGDPHEISLAARHVDELWPRPSSDLATLLRRVREQRARGIGMFAQPNLIALQRACESVGDSSRMTLQAIPLQENEQ